MANRHNSVIYVGVTNDLINRVYAHKMKLADGFTKKYNTDKLIYYEVFENINDAISREKQLKAGRRSRKIDLIDFFNPGWKDLYDELSA